MSIASFRAALYAGHSLLLFCLSATAFADAPAPPTWTAKSMREMMAMRDGRMPGPDFTKRFGKTNVQIAMRDDASYVSLPVNTK